MAEDVAELLRELHETVRPDEPAYVTLVRLLTLGGRLPFDYALDSLSLKGRATMLAIIGDDSLRLDGDSGLFVTQSPQGRISFTDAHPAEGRVVGRLELPPATEERIAESVLAMQVMEQAAQAELDSMLDTWAESGELTRRVRQVADWVDRVETVVVYIGDEIYSRSDAGTNTLLRSGRLAKLENTPLKYWSTSDRLFVAAAHVLFTAGRSIRFEEFNGRQLSAVGLRNWLVSTWRRYAHAVNDPVPTDLACRPMIEIASEVRRLASLVDASDWVRYRRILGLTFYKAETMVRLPVDERSHGVLPPAVADAVTALVGWSPPPTMPAESAVSAAVELALERPDAGELIAHLLTAVVHAAAVDMDADYAMSSAVRDLTRLAPLEGDRVRGILGLSKRDFFCCVMPNLNRLGDRPTEEIGRILWLVAQRMQYNRWHFVPGNFDRDEIPHERHYFFPPVMPDVAEFSDRWHGGHIAARVRYSIRAPGPQLWRVPLSVGGNAHRGSFDIRAVRMYGPPFCRRDMWTAVRYCGLVDAIWRTMATRVNNGAVVPTIKSFDRDWYQQAAWNHVLAIRTRTPTRLPQQGAQQEHGCRPSNAQD
jgi:hypothetical protein